MRLVKKVCVLMLGLAISLAISSVVRADAVTDWNAIAIQTIAGVSSHPGATALLDSPRLFALANLAMADAVITAWDTKFHYVFWRPLTAIQEADNDGNPETASDADWQPLINNPNYPELHLRGQQRHRRCNPCTRPLLWDG